MRVNIAEYTAEHGGGTFVPDRESAMILGAALGQLAIYSFEDHDSLPVVVDAPSSHCAACGAPMFVTVRGHHHTENGRDVTR